MRSSIGGISSSETNPFKIDTRSSPRKPQQEPILESHHDKTIEQAFAKMKTLLRKADARTIDETWRTIGALLDCFTPKECANYFRNAGYASA
jgi:hypothetical protein